MKFDAVLLAGWRTYAHVALMPFLLRCCVRLRQTCACDASSIWRHTEPSSTLAESVRRSYTAIVSVSFNLTSSNASTCTCKRKCPALMRRTWHILLCPLTSCQTQVIGRTWFQHGAAVPLATGVCADMGPAPVLTVATAKALSASTRSPAGSLGPAAPLSPRASITFATQAK